MIKIGSLFSGIGGFELGLERAIPGSKTIWQVEQNPFCQKVLKKHWPDAKIYNDVRNITKDNVEPIDILCGGFPCQDISLAGKGAGLHGKKSGLWWEMLRIISELSAGPKQPIVVLENVAAILIRGGCEVVGSLAEIGYSTEWTVISARDMGACHLRRRWFAVAYSDSDSQSNSSFNAQTLERISAYSTSVSRLETNKASKSIRNRGKTRENIGICDWRNNAPDSDSASCERERITFGVSQKKTNSYNQVSKTRYWGKTSPVSPLCGVDDGIPDRLDRLRALGNAIVPQCSEWVGQQIVKSGLLEDMI